MNVPPRHARGFSLVELIVVIVLIGIIGGVLTMQLLPAIRAYLAVSQRVALTHQADTALRRIVGEVRSAVPNSLRLGNAGCMELVPTRDGGRYRIAPDAGKDATDPGAVLEAGMQASEFDVLTTHVDPPLAGDTIVIGNQNTSDVYNRSNVARVDTIDTTRADGTGMLRVKLAAPIGIPPGYDGGRFLIVPKGNSVVTYRCENAGRNAKTLTGTGTLFRFVDPEFHPVESCATALPANAAVLADKVESCTFIYSPNQGVTQESGFIQLQLTLTDKGESVPLTIGAHVDNTP